jgi:hypothetical protein
MLHDICGKHVRPLGERLSGAQSDSAGSDARKGLQRQAVAAASAALNEYRQGKLATSRICIDTAQALCSRDTGRGDQAPACDGNVTSTVAKWAALLPARERGRAAGGRRLPHNLEGTLVRDFTLRDVGRFGDESIMVWDEVLDEVRRLAPKPLLQLACIQLLRQDGNLRRRRAGNAFVQLRPTPRCQSSFSLP